MRAQPFACLALSLFFAFAIPARAQQEAAGSNLAKVAASGDSALETQLAGKTIRVVISAKTVALGSPSRPPDGEARTNCTYSHSPCSQVTNIRISVGGKKLFVPRSVFADRTDVGNVTVTSKGGVYVLELAGGDASEAYSVRVFFTADRVKKRELYDREANALLETTAYEPSPVSD